MPIYKQPTLEEKLSYLVGLGKLKVDYQGSDGKGNHSTFGGLAKRFYYYEESSNLSSPVISSQPTMFFIGAHSYFNGGGILGKMYLSADTALLAGELR